jgi:phage gp45-like
MASIWNRLWHMTGHGKLSAPAVDTGPVQTVQLQLGDIAQRDAVPYVMHFGFSSNAPVGTDFVTISMQGDRSNMIAISSNNQAMRPTGLQPGEVMVYDGFGNQIHMMSGKIRLITPRLECTGNVVAYCDGNYVDAAHTHGGVQTGGGHTAVPDAHT